MHQQFEEANSITTPLVQQLQSPAIARQRVDELLAVVAEERRRLKIRRRRVMMGILAYVAFILMLVIFTKSGGVVSGMGGILSSLIAAAAVSKAQKKATKELAEFEDVRSVGPLAQALEYQDRELKAVAENKLTRLLPSLQASDASLLDEEQRKCLYRALHGRNTELVLAILKALEQVGDDKALPHVEKLAEGEGVVRGDFSRIREAAQACLPALQQRAEWERSRQTLLRAASASDTPSDVLLRPAGGTIEADPQQLLRASVAEERAG
jgi:hypothetical protein